MIVGSSPVVWSCSCGLQFDTGRLAFLHRDAGISHHVAPLTSGQRSGILRMESDPHWLEEELRHHAGTQGSEHQGQAQAEVSSRIQAQSQSRIGVWRQRDQIIQ